MKNIGVSKKNHINYVIFYGIFSVPFYAFFWSSWFACKYLGGPEIQDRLISFKEHFLYCIILTDKKYILYLVRKIWKRRRIMRRSRRRKIFASWMQIWYCHLTPANNMKCFFFIEKHENSQLQKRKYQG